MEFSKKIEERSNSCWCVLHKKTVQSQPNQRVDSSASAKKIETLREEYEHKLQILTTEYEERLDSLVLEYGDELTQKEYLLQSANLQLEEK
ncbi:MAG: hypothetical protein IJE08_13850 [Clostridia bacterium]|nr:hypothetical protein [Clostridia bacterium]